MKLPNLSALEGILLGLTLSMTTCLILTVTVDLVFSLLGGFFLICYIIALAVWLPKTKKRKQMKLSPRKKGVFLCLMAMVSLLMGVVGSCFTQRFEVFNLGIGICAFLLAWSAYEYVDYRISELEKRNCDE